jgi:triosephosphate isomerase
MMHILGNWKMNGLAGDLAEVQRTAAGIPDGVVVGLALPHTLVSRAAAVAAGTALRIGAQDVTAGGMAARTGDVNTAMLVDAGAHFVIVGHSERRAFHHEDDAMIAGKVAAAQAGGLEVVLCVGESLEERDLGDAQAAERVARQLLASLDGEIAAGGLVVAYEPIWAIGTGRTPTPLQIAAMHARLRRALVERFGDAGAGVALLYGGSAKPDNAAAIMSQPEINGALVGGASLRATDFLQIVEAAARMG